MILLNYNLLAWENIKNMLILFFFLLFLFAGPLFLLNSGKVHLFGDYRKANRDSVKLAPLPEKKEVDVAPSQGPSPAK